MPCPGERRKCLAVCAGSVSLLVTLLQTLLALNPSLPLYLHDFPNPYWDVLCDKCKLNAMLGPLDSHFSLNEKQRLQKVFYQLSNEFTGDNSCCIWHSVAIVLTATLIIHHIGSSACGLKRLFTFCYFASVSYVPATGLGSGEPNSGKARSCLKVWITFYPSGKRTFETGHWEKSRGKL